MVSAVSRRGGFCFGWPIGLVASGGGRWAAPGQGRPKKARRSTGHAGYSSVGRASDCRMLQQSDGPWFDSGWPDFCAIHCLTRLMELFYSCLASIPHSQPLPKPLCPTLPEHFPHIPRALPTHFPHTCHALSPRFRTLSTHLPRSGWATPGALFICYSSHLQFVSFAIRSFAIRLTPSNCK